MEINKRLLKYVSFICGTLLIIGFSLFLYGYFVSGLLTVTAVGIGIVMGAAFIFIMGIFLVATEETISKTRRSNYLRQ